MTRRVILSASVLVASAVGVVAPAGATTIPAPLAPGTCSGPAIHEQYPPAGYARSSPSDPYEVPIVARMVNAYLRGTTASGLSASIGPIDATACGTATLPSLTGNISPQNVAVNQNTVPKGAVAVSVAFPGLAVLDVYAATEGTISAGLSRAPANNGGINAVLHLNLKTTAVIPITPALLTALGGDVPSVSGLLDRLAGRLPATVECSLVSGDAKDNARAMGLSAGDLADMQRYYQENPKLYPYTVPIVATTGEAVGPGVTMWGQPVTGPPTDGQAEAVSDSSMLSKLYADIPPLPPSSGLPPSPVGCFRDLPPSVAQQLVNGFDQAVGFPVPAGKGYIEAPTTFSIAMS